MSDLPAKVLSRFRDIWGDQYDYSQFVYTGYQTKGIIICPQHGPFEKSPEKHINRRQGCKPCSNQRKSEKSTSTKEAFVAKAEVIHGVGRYDYSEFVYVQNSIKGTIRCVVHDIVFEQSPAHHLSGHCACDLCIQEKSVATHRERYGAEHHSQTAGYRDKVKQTSMERFGVEHHSKIADFRDVMMTLTMERFGVPFASQTPEFQERVRQTSQERFGFDHALKSPDVWAKIRQTNLERYGKENVKQTHIPDEFVAILEDKEQIIELLKTLSVREIARLLGIADCTLGRYCFKHGILLPASSYEAGITKFLQDYVSVRLHDRLLIKPREIDIVIDSHKLGIEFGGIYYHGEIAQPDRNYHLDKLRKMQARGWHLITIFEDEWLHKRSIVESRLRHIIGHGEKGVGARRLTIRPISSKDSHAFLEEHHIQGSRPAYARYGGFHGTKLIAVMTFSQPRVALGRTTGAIELLRFATDGKNYPGVASRLFQAFVHDTKPTRVISYADRRWSEGNLYRQLGFDFVGETQPNYWYTDRNKIIREHRFNYRKDRIKHLVENGEQMTERKIMAALGRDRIWDCGSLKFEWPKS